MCSGEGRYREEVGSYYLPYTSNPTPTHLHLHTYTYLTYTSSVIAFKSWQQHSSILMIFCLIHLIWKENLTRGEGGAVFQIAPHMAPLQSRDLLVLWLIPLSKCIFNTCDWKGWSPLSQLSFWHFVWDDQLCFSARAKTPALVLSMMSDLDKHAKRIPTWVLVSIKHVNVKLVKKTSDVKEFEKSLDSPEYTGVGNVADQILKGVGSQG